MIKCICNNISENSIKQMAEETGLTVKEVEARLGCGTGCGSCVDSEYSKQFSEWMQAFEVTLGKA